MDVIQNKISEFKKRNLSGDEKMYNLNNKNLRVDEIIKYSRTELAFSLYKLKFILKNNLIIKNIQLKRKNFEYIYEILAIFHKNIIKYYIILNKNNNETKLKKNKKYNQNHITEVINSILNS